MKANHEDEDLNKREDDDRHDDELHRTIAIDWNKKKKHTKLLKM